MHAPDHVSPPGSDVRSGMGWRLEGHVCRGVTANGHDGLDFSAVKGNWPGPLHQDDAAIVGDDVVAAALRVHDQ